MRPAVTVEVTFVPAAADALALDAVPAEGVVRMPDETLRRFCGWIDLLGALEDAAAAVHTASGTGSRPE